MLRLPFALVLNLFSILGHLLDLIVYGIARLFRKRKRIAVLELQSSYPFSEATGLAKWMNPSTSWFQLRTQLQNAAKDPDLHGVIIRIKDPLAMGPGRLSQLSAWLGECQDEGKEVALYSEVFSTRDYVLAAGVDSILMPPQGRLYTFGLRFHHYFVAPILSQLGVRAQFIHIGSFKTASNQFIKSTASTEQDRMMHELLDRLSDLSSRRVADGRGDPALLETVQDHAPVSARAALNLGAIDGEVFWDDIPRWLEHRDSHAHYGVQSEKANYQLLDWETWENGLKPTLNWRPLLRRQPILATIDLSGMIVEPNTPVPGGSAVINPAEIMPVLRRLKNDPRIVGVLIHINSPGGSVGASDILWKAIDDVRAQKPVVAYCSDVVGSGGYYLAVGADRIYCEESSIVGSIGVVAGSFSFKDTAEKIGLQVESVSRSDSSAFLDPFSGLSDKAIHRLQEDARASYRRFLERVGQARRIPRRRLHRYARGRVYLGKDAHRRGLVDGLGGLEAALEALHELTQTTPSKTRLKSFSHRKMSLSGAFRSSILGGLSEVSSTAGWFARGQEVALCAEMFRREKTLALMPFGPQGLEKCD